MKVRSAVNSSSPLICDKEAVNIQASWYFSGKATILPSLSISKVSEDVQLMFTALSPQVVGRVKSAVKPVNS